MAPIRFARRQTGAVRSNLSIDRLLPWLLRLLWIVVLVAGGAALDGAVIGRSAAVADTVRYGSLSMWVLGVLAMAIPAVVSLTAVRLIVPVAVPVAIVTLAFDTPTTDGVLFLAVAVVAALVALSAELGRVFVQASAYGEEDRHLLRPPAAYALASALLWAICTVAVIAAPLLLAARNWIAGAIVAAIAVGGVVLGWPRWHRLSRRWFVVVPIGVVIHDQVVLAETVMLRRQELARIRLAPADTDAADLTGPASGHAIEIATVEPTTAIYAATPKEPRGKAIHLTACLVAPTRPGRALRAADARRLPVG